jgi:quinol monooxygenase YgiN
VILASICMRPVTEKLGSVIGTIRRLLEPMRVQPGCLGFRCSRDIEDENVIVLEGRWQTGKDLEGHVRSDGFRAILSLLEESGEEPVVEFHHVTGTDGMEKIGELRG